MRCTHYQPEPNLRTLEGTPLQIAAAAWGSMVVKILGEREQTSKLNIIVLCRIENLYSTCSGGGPSRGVNVFLEKGAGINEQFFRSTVLAVAMSKGPVDIVRFLSGHGAQSVSLTRVKVKVKELLQPVRHRRSKDVQTAGCRDNT